jgi:hypothetical protein
MRKIAHRGFFAQINLPVRSAAPRLPSAAAGPSHSTHQFVCKAASNIEVDKLRGEDSYRKRPKSPSREDLGLITPSDAFQLTPQHRRIHIRIPNRAKTQNNTENESIFCLRLNATRPEVDK